MLSGIPLSNPYCLGATAHVGPWRRKYQKGITVDVNGVISTNINPCQIADTVDSRLSGRERLTDLLATPPTCLCQPQSAEVYKRWLLLCEARVSELSACRGFSHGERSLLAGVVRNPVCFQISSTTGLLALPISGVSFSGLLRPVV